MSDSTSNTASGSLTLPTVRIVDFILPSVAVVVTCFRLWDRARTARFWWDDAWALVAMIFMILFMSFVAVYLDDPTKHSKNVFIGIYYMVSVCFYSVVWTARTSILFTIIRLSTGQLRTILSFIGILFGVVWAILFAQIFWVCEGNPKWKESPNPQCFLGLNVAIAQVVPDVVSDTILIFSPLWMIYKTSRLSRPQKIRISAIFSTTIITTIVSVAHAYFVLKTGGIREGLAAIIETSVSLIVANLSVIIAFFFRITTEDAETDTSSSTVLEGGTAPVFGSLWNRGPTAPITSTFKTSDGNIREQAMTFTTVDTNLVSENTNIEVDENESVESSEK